MGTIFSRWLQTSTRKAALGIAGLAVAGGAAVVPAMTAAQAAPAAPPVAQAAAVTQPHVAPVDDIASKPAAKSVQHDYRLQPNFYYCGPAATRIALSATGHTLDMDEIAKKLGTTTDGTNSAADITRVLNGIVGGDKYKMTAIAGRSAKPADVDKLRADVVKALSDGRAVVANIAGTATDTNGVAHSYEGGHYLTVVGYTDQGRTVEIADPANPNGTVTYQMGVADLANWIATRGYSA